MSYIREQVELWGSLATSRGYESLLAEKQPEQVLEIEQQRLLRGYSVVTRARMIPRRRGADATGLDLAVDKRIAGKVKHRLSVVMDQWGASEADALFLMEQDEIKIEGASLQWQEWLLDWLGETTKHGAAIGRRCLEIGEPRTGNVMVHRIELELALITDVYKELTGE